MALDPSILNEAANEIRRDAKLRRATLALADELQKISSVENAANEAQARLDTLRAEETRVRTELEDLSSKLETIRARHAEVTHAHQEFLDQIVGAKE